MVYLHLFENSSDYEEAKGEGLKKPRVDYIEKSNDVIYTPLTATDLMEMLEGVCHTTNYGSIMENNLIDQMCRYNDSAYWLQDIQGSSAGSHIYLKFKESFNINSINFHVLYHGYDGSSYEIDETQNYFGVYGGKSLNGGGAQVIVFISDLAIPEEISSINYPSSSDHTHILELLELPELQDLLIKYKNNIFIATNTNLE